MSGLRGQLMLALYRSGRQADALAAYRAAREALVEQLGIEPGPSCDASNGRSSTRTRSSTLAPLDPPVAATGRPSPSLAARSTSFVGREKELREIRELLGQADVRLLTLTGPAGTGKTRLAVEATNGDGRSHDTVLVELAPIVDPGLVAPTIASTLGLSETSRSRATEALVLHLRGRRALLVLDNFEQVLAGGADARRLLVDAPGTQLLVTSRAPLDLPEERIYPVPPLQLADASQPLELARLRETEAIRLFVDRAREARDDFELSDENAEAVAELCRRLDGLPLALELAAARIKLLSPRAILERLGGRLELLKAVPGAGLPARHRTLRAAVDWSYDLLAADEQALFTSLGVFVGGFSLDGAAAVAGDARPGRGRRDRVSPQQQPASHRAACPKASPASECSRRCGSTRSSGWPSAATARPCGAAMPASTSGLPRRRSPRCSAPNSCAGRGGSTASAAISAPR